MEDEKVRHLPADLERAGALQFHVQAQFSVFRTRRPGYDGLKENSS